MKNKTFIIIAVIIVFAAIVANMPTKFDPKDEPQMADFPKVIGEWQGTDVVLSERDYQILETKNLIMREYTNDKQEMIYLYIIYSADNRRALHPPEVCYSGGGATIVEKSVFPLTPKLTVNKFITERKGSRHLVVYWFKSTSLSTYSYIKQQSKVVLDRLFGRKTSGAMIRVSADVRSGQDRATLEMIKAFCAQIEPLINRYVP